MIASVMMPVMHRLYRIARIGATHPVLWVNNPGPFTLPCTCGLQSMSTLAPAPAHIVDVFLYLRLS